MKLRGQAAPSPTNIQPDQPDDEPIVLRRSGRQIDSNNSDDSAQTSQKSEQKSSNETLLQQKPSSKGKSLSKKEPSNGVRSSPRGSTSVTEESLSKERSAARRTSPRVKPITSEKSDPEGKTGQKDKSTEKHKIKSRIKKKKSNLDNELLATKFVERITFDEILNRFPEPKHGLDLAEEASVVYECKACSTFFRGLASYVKHKQVICTKLVGSPSKEMHFDSNPFLREEFFRLFSSDDEDNMENYNYPREFKVDVNSEGDDTMLIENDDNNPGTSDVQLDQKSFSVIHAKYVAFLKLLNKDIPPSGNVSESNISDVQAEERPEIPDDWKRLLDFTDNESSDDSNSNVLLANSEEYVNRLEEFWKLTNSSVK